jgi:hypothetical protein
MQSRGWQLLYVLLIAGTAYAETTENLLTDQWDVNGNVLVYPDGNFVFSYTQGTVSQTVDLSTYDQINSINFGGSSLGCNNYVGGSCGSTNPNYYDQLTVILTYGGETWQETYTLDYNAGFIDYGMEVTPSGSAESALLEFTSLDPGFWGGYYASYTTNTYLTVAHSEAAPVVLEPEPVPVTEDPAVQSVVLDSVIMPTVDPVATVEIPTISVEVATVEVEVSTPDSTVSSEPTATSTPESSESSSQSDTEPSGGSSEPSGGKSSTSTAVATVMSNIDVASASMDTIGDIAGDPASPVAQVLALAVMAAQGVEIEDVKLDQPELPKGPKLKDNKKLADRMWINALASDAKFDKYMVEAQWK